MSEVTQRRLAAIVSVDVVGYSRLMGADEAGTLATMRAHRGELWNPAIEKFGGRVVGTAGDSLLVEFASAVAAVESSIVVQRGMVERNADLPDDKRMLLRIGINIGEVIIDGDDIFGEGVNIAARMQEIAAPGGIAISRNVQEQVRDKLETVFVDDGAHELKNIAQPVHVWRWPAEGQSSPGPAASAEAKPLPLPDKPSIAVLAFDNMSDDPEQEYFSDGISEDIITGLSKIQWLFVIARNSSFTYKGQPVDVKNVGRDLGVQYVLEGSVRRGGKRVRVTAQLIEAESGRHVWADRYDGDLDNIFELQDEITAKILSAIGPELTMAEVGRTSHKRAHDFTAWDRYLQALPFAHEITKVGFDRAVSILENSIELDPKFSNAYAMLCYCYALAAYHGWTPKVRDAIRQSIEHGDKAVALDPQNPMAQANLGWAYMFAGPQEKAARTLRRALELDPNSAAAWAALGWALGFMGEPKQAMEAVENAKRGSPRDPMQWQWFMAEVMATFAAGRLEKTVEVAKIVIQLQPSWFGAYAVLAASAAHLGRTDVAREAVETLLKLVPRFSMNGLERNPMFERPDDAKRLIDGMRLAGLPE